MFDELVKQARRLFSTKTNSGKQVSKLTDRMHAYKQILLATSMALLLAYTKFRDSFLCQGIEGVDAKTTTNFCLINGTTTIINRPPKSSPADVAGAHINQSPHAGLLYESPENEALTIIHHNYMRSLWALLILLAVCSYVGQLKWANLFKNEVLQAILQLRGHESSRLVKAAEKARPYEMLSLLSSDLDDEMSKRTTANAQFNALSRSEQVARKIDLVDSYVNIYDHTLDYYPNQLTYLLLTRNTAAFKLSCLELRTKLLIYASSSTVLTLLQFLLPLFFINNEYFYYGYRYLEAFCVYAWKLIRSDKSIMANSLDYELSSNIFPISTQCEYQQYGLTGELEHFTVQCTVSINELCGKLFVLIWWLVAFNIVIEICSLLALLVSSINLKTIRATFGLRFWPHARDQVEVIVTFRHKRAQLLLLLDKISSKQLKQSTGRSATNTTSNRFKIQPLDEREKKRLEAEGIIGSQTGCGDGERERQGKNLLEISPNDLYRGVCGCVSRAVCCMTNRRRKSLEQEAERDINLYYLLYLIYLRLDQSKSKIEEVIKMTAQVLNSYLDDLKAQIEREQAGANVYQRLPQPLTTSQTEEGEEEAYADAGDLPASVNECRLRHAEPATKL